MKIFKSILSWAITVLCAIIVAILLQLFVFQTHVVIGTSMYPTLNDGDLGIMTKISRTIGKEPEYLDIVIFDSRVNYKHSLLDDFYDSLKFNMITNLISKNENHIYWIKRVIGKSGDVIEIKNSKIYRNGIALEEPYIFEPMADNGSFEKTTVPEGYVFLMGDNRNNSSDSRVIGCVPIQNIIGILSFTF